MASELYNIIEGVSREKGIDPRIVVSAVEDAIVVATRKYYKTQENLRAVLDKDSGKINAYAVKAIVEAPEQVEDPNLQVTVEQARKLDPSAEAGGELLIPTLIFIFGADIRTAGSASILISLGIVGAHPQHLRKRQPPHRPRAAPAPWSSSSGPAGGKC